jgi:acyl-CoA thioester hydrolase
MTDPRSSSRAEPGQPGERPSFRCAVPIQIRFRDTDAMGHVNNAVYLTYLEVARTAYWHQVFAVANYNAVDFILARAAIDFVRPLHIADQATVWIRVNEIGEKSFGFAYEIVTAAGIAAHAETTQVMFDYAAGRSKPMATAQRAAILAFEAPGSVRERARSSAAPRTR